MEKIIIEEILKECKWYEKIIVRIFKKTFIKIYGIAGKRIFNQTNL